MSIHGIAESVPTETTERVEGPLSPLSIRTSSRVGRRALAVLGDRGPRTSGVVREGDVVTFPTLRVVEPFGSISSLETPRYGPRSHSKTRIERKSYPSSTDTLRVG